MRFLAFGFLTLATIPFVVFMVRSYIKIIQDNPGTFNTRRFTALLPLWGPMFMYMAALFLTVGVITFSQSTPTDPKPVTSAVSSGSSLELPQTKGFDRLIWAAGDNLDISSVECEQVSNNPNFNGDPVPVKHPSGWPVNYSITFEGQEFYPLTATDVFDGDEILCSGGNLESYFATEAPKLSFYKTTGLALMTASPLVFILGLGITLGFRKATKQGNWPPRPRNPYPYPNQPNPNGGPYAPPSYGPPPANPYEPPRNSN